MPIAPGSLGERLRACMDRGKLSISDLALWLDRSRASVNNWVRVDSNPREVYLEEILRRVRLLEKLIYRVDGPLVPYSIGSHERPVYLRRLYNAHNDSRVLARRSAK